MQELHLKESIQGDGMVIYSWRWYPSYFSIITLQIPFLNWYENLVNNIDLELYDEVNLSR